MNKEEISKEISDFLKFNASEIQGLMKLSPEIANAFSNVILAIDDQYGEGLISGSGSKNISEQINKKDGFRRFSPGDYLNDLLKIDIPFKLLTENGIQDYDSFNSVYSIQNNLIITGIYEIEGKLYYSAKNRFNVNYFKDEVFNIMTVFFEVALLDNYYEEYFQKYGRTKFKTGEYILFPTIPLPALENIVQDTKIKEYHKSSSTEGYIIVGTNANGKAEVMREVTGYEIYRTFSSTFIKDVQNVDGKNCYIFQQDVNFPMFDCYDANDYDNAFGFCNSVKNNDIFVSFIQTPKGEMKEYTMIKKVQNYNPEGLSTSNKGRILFWKPVVIDSDFTNRYPNLNTTAELSVDDFCEVYFTSGKNVKLDTDESRYVLEQFDKKYPIVDTIKTDINTTATNDIFVPVERKKYLDNASYNVGNTPRKSPTESATTMEEGTIMIGCDGGAWVVALDKNGKHRWKRLYDVFEYLPTELFASQQPFPTQYFKLKELQDMEKALFDALAYFNPTDVEYIETKRNLDAVRDYIMYSPNVTKK